MRPQLHRKALARFAIGVSAAVVLPVVLLGVAGTQAMPAALAVSAIAAVLGMSALRGGRRRATGRARA